MRIGGSDTHENGVFQLVVIDAMMPALIAWLDSRGLDLVKGPLGDDDEPEAIPWYFVGIRDL